MPSPNGSTVPFPAPGWQPFQARPAGPGAPAFGPRRFTFYCQKCGAPTPVKLTVEQGFDSDLVCCKCGATGRGAFDDMPPDTGPVCQVGDEGSSDYFDRYQAGDR